MKIKWVTTIFMIVLSYSIFAQNNHKPYLKEYKYKNISILLTEENKSTSPEFKDLYYLLQVNNKNTLIQKEGQISRTGIENSGILDLDKDGNPEIYIYFTNAGTSMSGNLVMYEIDGYNLDRRDIPNLNLTAQEYYRGNDEYIFEKNKILRNFPAYNSNDANCCPTAGSVKVSYVLSNNKLVEETFSLDKSQELKKISKNYNVLIKRAFDIPNMDNMSASDTWIEVIRNGSLVGKSELFKDNNSPNYNLELSLDSEIVAPLVINVYDKDLTKNEKIGSVIIQKIISGIYPIMHNFSDGGTKVFGQLEVVVNK